MKFKRVVYFYIIFFFGASLAFGFGYLVRAIQEMAEEPELPILEQAYDILKNHAYADLPDPPELEYGMIHGMAQAYGDPYTRFEEPAQHELSTDQLEGEYGGIGSTLEHDPEGFIILHPFPEGPAAKAGVLDGDRLIKVDNTNIVNYMPMNEVVAALRGPEGEKVTIEILRLPENTIYPFSIKRENLPLPSVTWHLNSVESWIGIIQVNLIAASTVDEIQNAVHDLRSHGATHFVLDLRGNSGGLLTQGIDITRLFLQKGTIIQEHYRNQDTKTYTVNKPGRFAEIPLVVLVNKDTASAAEIIAGALKVQNRAHIIGTQTFGKDSIQLVFSLQDGSSIHVTAAKWWVPGLEFPIGDGGLEPDILVSTEDVPGDAYIQAAIQDFHTQP